MLITHKGNEFIFPAADGTAKLSGGDYEFREPTLRREQTARSEDFSRELQGEPGESQPTESTDDAEAPARLLVWTSSSTLCAEGRNIPYSTEIHWCDEVYSHWSGRHARETCRFEQKLVRFVERLHEVHSIERKTSEGIHMLRWETDKSSNDYQTRSCMARSMDENWWSRSESRRTRMEKREAQTRQRSKTERNLLCWFWWPRLKRNSQKYEKKNGKTYGSRHAVQDGSSNWHHDSGWKAGECIPKDSENDLWLQSGISWIHEAKEWNLLYLRNTKITLQAKVLLRWPITILCTNWILCLKQWKKSRCKSGQGMEKSSRQFQHGNWKNQEQEGGYSRSTKRQKESPLCYTDGHMCHLKNAELGPKLQKYKGRVVLRGDIVNDSSGSDAVFFWTGLVCVQNNCRKSNGCNCKVTRLWRTSSWCSVCLHSSEIGGRSQIAQKS